MSFPELVFILSKGVQSLPQAAQEEAQSMVACLIEEETLVEVAFQGLFSLVALGQSFYWATEPVDALSHQKRVWLCLARERGDSLPAKGVLKAL